MPAGFYTPSSEIEPIVGIQLCVFSPDEIEKRSVVEITNAGTYEGNEPKIGGLFDPRMGVIDNGKECRSCGQTNHKCPGHFGHFRLARPVYYIQFLPFILNILSCICIRCSKLRIDKNYRSHFLKRKGEVRWREVLAASKEIHRCGQETEDGCGALQPNRFVREGIARIMAEWDDDANGSKSGKQTQILEVEYVLRLFRKILDEDVDFIGLNRYWCRPDWMICTVLPIPPPQVRPSVIQDNNQRSEDDLTHKLAEIVKTNNSYLQPKIDANAAKSVIDEWTNVLQYHIATLVDNQIPGVAPSAQRNGRPLKSIQQRLGSKEGRIRYNIQGKRVEFSARSVITPDPNISIAELGVPEKIAMNLTRPERVTIFNRNKLYRLIQNGPLKYPGAKTIRRADGRIISLRHVNTKEIILNLGDIVNRHLMDNDPILFNRQPTLHRMSMMAHRVKVLTGKTFRLNVSVTAPYNADFDGDEMNAHAPQSIEAATELEEIAAVPHQILRPRDGLPVIGIVQDTLVGSYRLTRDSVKFNNREFMNMMMWNKRFTGTLPPPKKDALHWSGQQIISQLLPSINLDMMNGGKKKVVIREGEVLEGQFDKGIFSKASKGIIHMTYNDYGSKDTVQLIDSLQNTVAQFLIYDGFSVGISDLIADGNTKKEMNETIQAKKKQIETVLLEVHQDLFDNNTGKTNQSELEDRAFGLLNKAMETAGEIGQNTLSTENRMIAMVRAGSKGGPINIAQMIACVGQQNIEGKRIPYGFEDRTLPHFKKYYDGAEARGFIENSFISGLTPTEFFFHAMSGREGLIDTAVKSVTGDTKIVILEDGVTKRVEIGGWIDAHMNSSFKGVVEHFPEENDLEILQLGNDSTYIPTVSANGKVSWGKIAAVTRHDPGQQLYEVTTLGGRSVIVPESKSLLIWRPGTKTFEQMPTPDVRPGHCMPVTMNLVEPPVLSKTIPLSKYLSKDSYLYGTDFQVAEQAVSNAMQDREHIPSGWWDINNGKAFTLPYDSKARFVRTLTRSKTDNILPGFVYPFTTNRDHARIPDEFVLNSENGRFIGLFLAEGNVDVKSGYVAITNNSTTICQFVHDWFESQRIRTTEDVKINAIGGVSTNVRGYSTVLAKFLDLLVGHGAASKRVPAEAFSAQEDFIVGLLDGYFSGDGTVSTNSVEAGSASKELVEGISMLCSRIGIFAKVFASQLVSNNLGTENILPTYRISIRAQWATRFAEKVTLIDECKNEKLTALKASSEHRNFPFQNDVVLDEIVDITPVSVDTYTKLYDLTVPETFTFGLANGLQVYDTADTGYIQRQIVKAMEDLVVQNDGTVRDANMNITQFKYGEDGINSTKIESQPLPLSTMTDDEINKEFGLKDVDITEVLGVPRGDDAVLLAEYTKQIFADRKMIVEKIFRSGRQGSIYSPVNLERLIMNIKIKFGLRAEQKTNLTPTTILKGIDAVLKKTQEYHVIWAALLRFYLSPTKLILQDRFTESAFDTLCEVLVTKNWQAWVQPGEHVGIIAAQSIGEPSTQMTLNSVDWDTKIMIAKNGNIICPQIGEFIDMHIEGSTEVKTFPNEQLYLELNDGNDWKAISCDENGKMMWTKLEAVTRHPVLNEDGTNTILEVTLASGRTVKATKGKSFLTCINGKVCDINGSELKVGDVLPIANSLVIGEVGNLQTLSLRELLPPTEWLYGTDVHAALAEMSNDRHWFQKNQGVLFTLPYSRSDSFREAFVDGKNTNMNAIQKGFVYPARTRPDVSQIPEEIPLTEEFGFFAGAYLAEGMANTTQVNITNNDISYLNRVNTLMQSWNVGTHTVCEERSAEKSGIKGTSTSLVIHSTLLASVMQKLFGRVSHEKTIPDWAFQAPIEFIRGLIDGYISGDGTIEKKTGCVKATSVSKELVTRLGTILSRFGIFSVISERTPDIGVFDSVRTNYTLYVPVKYSKVFASIFTLSHTSKQNSLTYHFTEGYEPKCRRRTTGDTVWDPITSIKEVVPIKGWVYDLTVETTRNFMTHSCILQKDTFHLAGVASKSNVTRGVPRLKELLKVTQNPKAVSLTIPLKPEFRNSKEKAREVAQDLELTLLRDMTVKTAIYYDPADNNTVLKEDEDLIAFYKLFEVTSTPEIVAGDDESLWSKWILRLELNREKMFDKNVTMEDILFVLRRLFDTNIRMVYSDFNSQKLIMRIRLTLKSMDDGKSDPSSLDALSAYKKFQNKLLNSVIIRGFPGIKAVTFRKGDERFVYDEKEKKYVAKEEYIIDTDGSNFLEAMNHPAVDGTRVYSTHVHDVLGHLGIEATRQILYNEIQTLFEDGQINYRHLGLLVDVMTRSGRLMSVDRYGINKLDIGPLAKASFEETERILLKAAVFGEIDPITGVSANIMTGQPMRGGTTFTEILLDEGAFMSLQKNMPEPPTIEQDEDSRMRLDPLDVQDVDDMCSPSRLKLSMTLPTKGKLLDEDDIDFAEVEDDSI
jgi:DNA-directed RNA polymerase beta' subunit